MNPYTHTNRFASIALSAIGADYVVSVFLLNDAGQPDYADGELFVRDYQSTESAAALAAFERWRDMPESWYAAKAAERSAA